MKLKQRSTTELIVIHSSATKADLDIGVREIDQWHRKRGFVKVGYHFVIRRNGVIENGRDIGDVGAHAVGHNSTSIGICLVGGLDPNGKAANNYSRDQWTALKSLLTNLGNRYPTARIVGHRDLSPDKNGNGIIEPSERLKECPCFDVSDWLKTWRP